MNPWICAADAGSSYFRPCLKDMDRRSLRTVEESQCFVLTVLMAMAGARIESQAHDAVQLV